MKNSKIFILILIISAFHCYGQNKIKCAICTNGVAISKNYMTCQNCKDWADSYRNIKGCDVCKNNKTVVVRQKVKCTRCKGTGWIIEDPISFIYLSKDELEKQEILERLDATYKYRPAVNLLRSSNMKDSEYFGYSYDEKDTDGRHWEHDLTNYRIHVFDEAKFSDSNDNIWKLLYDVQQNPSLYQLHKEKLKDFLGYFSELRKTGIYEIKKVSYYDEYDFYLFIPNVIELDRIKNELYKLDKNPEYRPVFFDKYYEILK